MLPVVIATFPSDDHRSFQTHNPPLKAVYMSIVRVNNSRNFICKKVSLNTRRVAIYEAYFFLWYADPTITTRDWSQKLVLHHILR